NCNRPPVRMTCPVPLHVAQATTGPPVSPAPWQREHCSDRLTVMLVVRPLKDSSKLRASGISMSRPFFGIARGGSGGVLVPAAPPLPPNRSEKISRKLELPPPPEVCVSQEKPEKSKPAAPAPPAPAPAPKGESGSRLSL